MRLFWGVCDVDGVGAGIVALVFVEMGLRVSFAEEHADDRYGEYSKGYGQGYIKMIHETGFNKENDENS